MGPARIEEPAGAADTIRLSEQLRTHERDGLSGTRVLRALIAPPVGRAAR